MSSSTRLKLMSFLHSDTATNRAEERARPVRGVNGSATAGSFGLDVRRRRRQFRLGLLRVGGSGLAGRAVGGADRAGRFTIRKSLTAAATWLSRGVRRGHPAARSSLPSRCSARSSRLRLDHQSSARIPTGASAVPGAFPCARWALAAGRRPAMSACRMNSA
jgi:hypothetical protein